MKTMLSNVVASLVSIVLFAGLADATTPPSSLPEKTSRMNSQPSAPLATDAKAAFDFNLRSGPYFDYAQIGFIGTNTPLTDICYIPNAGRQWHLVRSSSRVGFVPRDNLTGSITNETCPGTNVHASVEFNLRSGPYFDYAQIGFIGAGTPLTDICYILNVGEILGIGSVFEQGRVRARR